MNEIIAKHKLHWSKRSFVYSALGAVILFALSVTVNISANQYAVLNGKNPVTDIVLSNTRVFDVDFLVNYGPLLMLAVVILILFMRPAAIPFTVKSLALFIFIRAGFISLTHLGQFQPQLILPTSGFLNFIGGGNTGGLFFSGHTGVPFLLALIFWDNRTLRYGFIALSVILGSAMLLAHLHYTIDVLGAFFITPTIYTVAKKLFARDFTLLTQGTS